MTTRGENTERFVRRDRFNIAWNSRKKELTTNIDAWTPLDSEKDKQKIAARMHRCCLREVKRPQWAGGGGDSSGATRGLGGAREKGATSEAR